MRLRGPGARERAGRSAPLKTARDTTMRGMWRGRWRRGDHLPPSRGSTPACIAPAAQIPRARLVRVSGYAVSLCRQGVARFGSPRVGAFCRRVQRRGEQPGRERPHLQNADLTPAPVRGSLTSRLRDLDPATDYARQCCEQSTSDPIANPGDNPARDSSRFAVDHWMR
jgi:hypothetical protein